MMKALIFATGALLLSIALPAQEEFPVVVVSCKGKVHYTSATTPNPFKVMPGAVLKNSGTLQLKGNATAVVYRNGLFERVQGKGAHSLAGKDGGQGDLASLNFDNTFGKYVEDAVMLTARHAGVDGWGTGVTDPKNTGDGWGTGVSDPKNTGDGWGTGVSDPKNTGDGWGTGVSDPKNTGDGWGTGVSDPKNTGDGWGGKGNHIILLLPYGNLLPGTQTFFWSRPAGASLFQLDILDASSKIIHSVTVPDTFALVDLKRLNLSPGQRYTWQVRVPGSDRLVSTFREFAVASTPDRDGVLQKLKKSPTYTGGEPVLQGIMEAVALEKAEWFGDAEQRYAALSKKYAGNNMLRMAHAAFWVRCRLEPKAKAVMLH